MNSDDQHEKRRDAPAAGDKLRAEVELLMHQLRSSVPNSYGSDLRQTLVQGTGDFYHGFKAKDRMETLLIRHIVILNNVATECLYRGMNTSKPEARAVDLRSGLKAIALMAELTKRLERRRDLGQQNINGAADRAPVANIGSAPEPKQASDPAAVGEDAAAKPGRKTKAA